MRIQSRWINQALALVALAILRCLFATCRVQFHSVDPTARRNYADPSPDAERFICCCWHDALVLATFTPARPLRERTMALISPHRDGGYLAASAELMGYRTVRGSSRRGAASAIRRLMVETALHHIYITPDGPQGPARKLKLGPIYLASQLGRRLVPNGMAATSSVKIHGRWSHLTLPCPFSTVHVLDGPFLTVPAEASRDDLNTYAEWFETLLNLSQEAAEQIAHGAAPHEVLSALARHPYAASVVPGSTEIDVARTARPAA